MCLLQKNVILLDLILESVLRTMQSRQRFAWKEQETGLAGIGKILHINIKIKKAKFIPGRTLRALTICREGQRQEGKKML